MVTCCALSLSCGDGDPRPLDWSIVFADDAVRSETHLVEATIRRDGCGGEVLWSDVLRPDDLHGMRPPALPPGPWGFAARARDADCRWIAEGCEEVQLGSNAQPATVRTLVDTPTAVAACPLAECAGGECSGLADGGRDGGMPIDGGEMDAGPDGGRDAGRDGGTGCDPADDQCVGGELTTCDPSSGASSTVSCPLGCASDGSVRCARVVPSNVDPSLLDDTLADVSMTSGGTIDTSDCDPGFGSPSVETIELGVEVCVVSTGALTLDGIWRVTGSRPLVLLAAGEVHIDALIDLSARGAAPGPGGFSGGGTPSADGSGPGSSEGGGGQHVDSFDDGGGGGGGGCGAGGAGGEGTSGVAAGGTAGTDLSGGDLIPIVGGAGGGAGGGGATSFGAGGGGGGALQITSSVAIRIDRSIHAGGGGGQAGISGGGNAGAGGGGGAGGAVLLEAPVITVTSGAIVAASGGGGGSGSDFSIGDGSAGDDARGNTSRPSGGAPIGTSGAGGSGGAGDSIGGGDGLIGDNNGGGGGGGAGCILFRTPDGSVPGGTGGFSPSTSPGLRAMSLMTD